MIKKITKSEQQVLDDIDGKRPKGAKWLIRHDKAARKLVKAKVIYRSSADSKFYRVIGSPVKLKLSNEMITLNLAKDDAGFLASTVGYGLNHFELSDSDTLRAVRLYKTLKSHL